MKIMKIHIKNKYAQKYKKGYPLIEKKAFVAQNTKIGEGSIIDLYDEYDHFVARGYYGIQNKGHGWVLTLNPEETIHFEFFKEKIRTAIQKRVGLFDESLTNAYRLFNGEGDGIGGLTIDFYNGFYLVTWYSLGIYAFKEFIIESLEKVTNVSGIYEKKRFKSATQMQETKDYVLGEKAPEPLIVKENGVNFATYLDDGPMVGFFLDQRDVRKTLMDKYASGKTVLNTFSYTGAFSVFAALAGAKTTSVDLANRSLTKTQEQFSINGIDSSRQTIIVEDVFKYFKYATRKHLLFDVVILDPPSFARSKKKTFSVANNYVELLQDAIAVTKPGGMIIASTNYSGFNMKKFQRFVAAAFKTTPYTYRIRKEFSLPDDFLVHSEFPEGNYLKVVFIEKGK
jgi:23S rRNA (cytosine1962-C5)-methyltransferase